MFYTNSMVLLLYYHAFSTLPGVMLSIGTSIVLYLCGVVAESSSGRLIASISHCKGRRSSTIISLLLLYNIPIEYYWILSIISRTRGYKSRHEVRTWCSRIIIKQHIHRSRTYYNIVIFCFRELVQKMWSPVVYK